MAHVPARLSVSGFVAVRESKESIHYIEWRQGMRREEKREKEKDRK